MFFDSCICPECPLGKEFFQTRLFLNRAQPSPTDTSMHCSWNDAVGCWVQTRAFGRSLEMKHLGNQQHASWQEEHNVPTAELTLLEFRKELIDVGMLKSAASRNIIRCGGYVLLWFYRESAWAALNTEARSTMVCWFCIIKLRLTTTLARICFQN